MHPMVTSARACTPHMETSKDHKALHGFVRGAARFALWFEVHVQLRFGLCVATGAVEVAIVILHRIL